MYKTLLVSNRTILFIPKHIMSDEMIFLKILLNFFNFFTSLSTPVMVIPSSLIIIFVTIFKLHVRPFDLNVEFYRDIKWYLGQSCLTGKIAPIPGSVII